LFDLLFDSEVGGSMLLRNVGGLLLDYGHDVTTQKTVLVLVTAVRTSYRIYKTFRNDIKNYLSTVTTFRDLVSEHLRLQTYM
jgi:hypothetical protein